MLTSSVDLCVRSRPVWLSRPLSSAVRDVVVLSSFLSVCLLSQSEQNAKKGEDLDADDEKIGEEDSHFMKLAKKLTAKTLQRKGLFLSSHTEVELFCRWFQTFAKTLQLRIQGSGGNQTFLPPAQTESTGFLHGVSRPLCSAGFILCAETCRRVDSFIRNTSV